MISIILPYENASNYYRLWANDEENVDFRRDLFAANRCTLSFAATELVHYLGLLGFEAEVSDSLSEMTVRLLCGDCGEDFTISRDGDAVVIRGSGRVGLLYGVYEFLEAQGIRWYSPSEEYVPSGIGELAIPIGEYSPDMPLGRGFVFEGPLKESKSLYLWMARNKLNLSTLRYNTLAFQRKLGMIFKMAGHIFEDIINPNNRTESGETFFDAHSDWYGKNDVELTPENALHTQFCVSNDELLEFLWQALKKRMQNEWYEADRMDLAGFDTWGRTCQCEKCRKLGNGSDQMLHFISYMRKRLDESLADGTLDHDARFVLASYEGTATIEPPINEIPENLKKSGDYVVFFPILRCYEHEMWDKDCRHNAKYQPHIENWQGIPLMMGEYYNVSRYEELPLVFKQVMPRDFANYRENGVTGMTYMHLPMLDWGIKTLTQYLYAKLCWNVQTDVGVLLDRYFAELYGELASDARRVYELCEQAGRNIASWRNWNNKSVLYWLQCWNGRPLEREIFRDDHLGTEAVAKGWESVRLFREAVEIMNEMREQADELYMKGFVLVNGVPINPNDARSRLGKNRIGERISSDIRALRYAVDMYELITRFLEYSEALSAGRDTDEMWRELRALCLKAESYCYGVRFDHPIADIRAVDVLERSGLKDLYYKCMVARTMK